MTSGAKQTRMPLVAERDMDPEVQALFAEARLEGTPALGVLQVKANHPPIMKAMVELWRAVFWEGVVSLEIKEAVRLYTVNVYNCEVCADLSALPAQKQQGEIARLLDFENQDFPPEKKAALAYAQALMQGRGYAGDEVYAELHKHFTPAQVVELGTLVAINMGFVSSLVPSWNL